MMMPRVIALHSRTWVTEGLAYSFTLEPCKSCEMSIGTIFGIFRVTSRTIREIAWKRMGQHCAQAGRGRPVPSYSKGSTAKTGAFPIDFVLYMLPDRENSHRLQQATTWRQEGHRTLCHNPFHGHASLPENVTETTSNFTRGLHRITRKATVFNRHLPLHSLIEASSQKGNIW